MKRILICGCHGFIGRNLVSYLTRKSFSVFGLSHRQYINKEIHEEVYSELTQSNINDIILNINPDVTIFLAANYNTDDVNELLRTNIILPTMIMKAISKLPINQRKMIITDSYWSLGDESSRGIALDEYAVSKLALKEMAKTYSYYNNFSIINLVVYGTYGQKDDRGKVIDKIIYSVKKHEELKLSAGEQLLDLVHIEDICSGYLSAINEIDKPEYNKKCITYALSSRMLISIRDIVEFIQQKNDCSSLKLGALSYRDREIFKPIYSYPNIPNWSAKVELLGYIENAINDNK